MGVPAHRLFNRVLRKLKLPLAFGRSFDHYRDMLSLEQAGNLQLLLTEVLDHGVPGAVVELGCHVGGTTAVLARVLQERDPSRELHTYDAFLKHWSTDADPRQRFEANFKALGLPLPRIHEGDVRTTVPAELPERIAFALWTLASVAIRYGIGSSCCTPWCTSCHGSPAMGFWCSWTFTCRASPCMAMIPTRA